MPKRSRFGSVTLILAAAFLLTAGSLTISGPSFADDGVPAPIEPQEMLEFFDFDDDDVRELEAGKIVSRDMPELEGTDTGLGVAFAMVVPHGVDDCSEQFAGPEMFRVDPNMLGFGVIDPLDVEGSLRGVALTNEEAEEARNLLSVAPGSDFNLSTSEIQRIRAATGSNAVATASAAYRQVLRSRFEKYQRQGLAGIEDYARGKKKTSRPGEELRVALANSPMLESRLPALHRHLAGFPNDKAEGVQERFYWVKRNVEGRPIFSLIHWSLLVHEKFAFLSEREFYASHTYNAQDVHFGVLPYKAGVMVFFLHRTFTDQVDIFAKAVAHRIGRGKIAEPIRQTFENLRKQVAGH